MKKILFLINTLTYGGAEKVLIDTVNNLDKDKYEITVQTFLHLGPHTDKLNSNIKYKSVIKTKSAFLRKMFFKIINTYMPSKWVYNLFIKDNYDIEIAFLPSFPTRIISASTNKKAKKISWLHGTMIKKGVVSKTFGSAEKEKAAYKKFDCIVCVSEDSKKSFIERMGEEYNLKVLYNIFDSENILKRAGEECSVKAEITPVLVSVGRLEAIKGYTRLLKIHKLLIEEGLFHTLWIIGEGSQHALLQEFIDKNNLQKTVKLLGYHDNPYKYVKNADLFVCPSLSEGFNMAVSEAVLLGVPVISTEWSGVYEPFNAPRCSVVVKNSNKALYEGLKEILLNPQKIEAFKNETAFKKQFFTTEHLISEFEKFLTQISGGV